MVGRPLSPIEVTDTASGFRIVVPLNGIDARHFYVFALPHSVLIEMRMRTATVHCGADCEETQNQRVTRELRLTNAIKEGGTTVRLLGSNLEITCSKAPRLDDKAWSELIQLQTHCSLGGV